MKPLQGLRTWWQKQTGEEETPFDGDAPAWVVSMIINLLLVFVLAFIPLGKDAEKQVVEVTTPPPMEEDPEELTLDEFAPLELPTEEIGAQSLDASEMAAGAAPEIANINVVTNPLEIETTKMTPIQVNPMFELSTAQQFENLPVKGHVGVGTKGASGAIDMLTKEILRSMEEEKTLVVWLFDQSGSLERQRREITERFDRIYKELGLIEASEHEAFTKHDDKPLLTSVVAFGKDVTLRTKKSTDNLAEIKEAIANIEMDESGEEKVFSAIYMAVDHFKHLRQPGDVERNVMIVAFTDEKGDDAFDRTRQEQPLDVTIKHCKRYRMPVYVVGVPAPFGREKTLVKWVDPDPDYDQTPQWGEVTQGPETFLPERIKLHFAGSNEETDPIDSGFGPFALTRLCYETGGIYFTVHPNRNVNQAVSRRETAAFSAHIEHFFDPNVMRKYRPDYVSAEEYYRRVNSNQARAALVQAAQMTSVTEMSDPRLRFVKRDEASFANALTEAQKEAAKLEPNIARIVETLEIGEADREKETTLRWQAGYDLAVGRALAVYIRAKTYNAMLAEAKRGLKFENEKSNTWVLKPSDEITTGSQDARLGERAKEYLERVVDEHPNTPWALLARRELENPIGWTWTEEYTAPPEPRRPGMPGNANPNPPNPNEAPNMLKRPPKRKVPKL